MEGRALWNAGVVSAAATPTTSPPAAYCTSFTLPSGGVIALDSFSTVTLAADAIVMPRCTGTIDVTMADVTSGSDLREPFYASTLPQCYALAATTVIAYMLVIMLFITPRTFLSGGILVLGRRGFTNGPSGSAQGIGIGGRPWLQKVAALTVAVSLTIATANTFRVAEDQYNTGYMDAFALQNDVLDSLELKIIRVISDTFLWLAQAQTLIRLFPRQREKVIIKWTAFALISLNLIFSILNTFVYPSNSISKPYSISEPIPAVSYLFHLALGLLYGAWVVYYGFTKKDYAFYHPRMRNICLVALMSVTSVIVPVVFFVLDISKPKVAGWGDYVRWVGAAAASVVVWEWVERIEALERHDKKDGVLGREVFDGDEMLEVTPSSDITHGRRRPRTGENGGRGGSSTGAVGSSWPTISRYRPKALEPKETRDTQANEDRHNGVSGRQAKQQLPRWPTRPPPAATPVSRTDTGSAESTVYAIRYHPISEPREADRENVGSHQSPRRGSFDIEAQQDLPFGDGIEGEKDSMSQKASIIKLEPERQPSNAWETVQRLNPFRRKVQELPPEVSPHARKAKKPARNRTSPSRWDIIGRLEDFAALQAERLRDKARPSHESAPLPVTRIPAPPRPRTLQEIMEEIDHDEGPQDQPTTQPRDPAGKSSLPVSDATATPVPPKTSTLVSSSRPRELPTPGERDLPVVSTRGNISFAPPDQSISDRERRIVDAGETLEAMGAHSGPRSLQAQSTHQQEQPASPGFQTQNPEYFGLPVLRIPAPPRRSRSEG